MSSRLPPLNALRAFEAAARHGSFTLAAEELCVTPGAVSRQIKALEEHFGLALFARGHKLVTLTGDGARYFAQVTGPFAELARAGETLCQANGPRQVRLDCVPTLAMHWLLPRLERFRAAHPGIEVVMQTSVGPVDAARDFHLSVRRDPAHFAGLAATPLMTEWCLPVCSPAYARDHRLTSLSALSRATALEIRAREDLWPGWCRAQRIGPAALGPRLVVDHTFVAMQAAEDGLGVAVVPLIFADRLLAAGRLVCPLPGTEAVSGTYSLLHRPGKEAPEVEAFARWLAGECATVTAPPRT
ncbi:MAG: LysR substrate-binding domain-containing protein [Magnetospirillum sp.]|nr:LysR substrate-binding domain-containing protein [Magnetospirillum sp.]